MEEPSYVELKCASLCQFPQYGLTETVIFHILDLSVGCANEAAPVTGSRRA